MDVENMEIMVADKVDKNKWSKFVQEHPHGNIFQTPEMYEVYKRTKNYEPIFLAVVDDDNNVLATLLAVVQKEFCGFLGKFTARSIIWGAPLVAECENKNVVVDVLLKEYDKIAQKKALYTQFRNLWDMNDFRKVLEENGYEYEEHLNFLIDLTKGKENLWSNITKSRRKGINRAMRQENLNIERITDINNIPTFYSLLKNTYSSAKIPLADISFFELVFKILHPKNMAQFYFVNKDNIKIACRVILTYKDTCYDFYAGADSKYLDKHPNEFLVWKILEGGSENGFEIFDFGGAGKPNKHYGPREFKRRFGGKLVNFGRFEKVYRPLLVKMGMMGFKLWKLSQRDEDK